MFSVDPQIPFAYDIVSLSFIAGILLLCFFSLAFIFHLRLKSRYSRHLETFNSLWTVRSLLVSFITLWALNELLRLPFFQLRFLYPFLPSLTLNQQTQICKIHVVLSLGFFQPGFFISLLFLVNVSVHGKPQTSSSWPVLFVLTTCLPICLLQTFVVFYSGWKIQLLPEIFQRTFVVYTTGTGAETVLCTYPLLATVIFGAFGVIYALWFLISCCRVVFLVINNGLRVRLYILVATVMITLPLQIVLLGLSVLWTPDEAVYCGVVLIVFLSSLTYTTVGQGFLVIRPIADSLIAGGHGSWWNHSEEISGKDDGHRKLVIAVDEQRL